MGKVADKLKRFFFGDPNAKKRRREYSGKKGKRKYNHKKFAMRQRVKRCGGID